MEGLQYKVDNIERRPHKTTSTIHYLVCIVYRSLIVVVACCSNNDNSYQKVWATTEFHFIVVFIWSKFTPLLNFYKKIHYLTRELRVKLHAKIDIARIARR